MGLSSAQEELISQIENCGSLSGRYVNPVCVNAGSAGERRGVLSLVFKAYDEIEENDVAIKFLDPDVLGNTYRLRAFEREPDILQQLQGKSRCLQLVERDGNFNWHLKAGEGREVEIPISYFTTSWIDGDIDEYFENQHRIAPLEKLLVFRKVLLSVEALHQGGVHHRDLKVDNFRVSGVGNSSFVVVIDFGTAAHLETAPLIDNYGSHVGAPAYSSPESFCGLAGSREIGHKSDVYALGNLLYELFNPNYCYRERVKNPYFRSILHAVQARIGVCEEGRLIDKWSEAVEGFSNAVPPPAVSNGSSSVPASIAPILDGVCRSMLQFDFRRREGDLSRVRMKIDSAIKLIENKKAEEVRRNKRILYRRNREEKLKRREARLMEFLSKRALLDVKQ